MLQTERRWWQALGTPPYGKHSRHVYWKRGLQDRYRARDQRCQAPAMLTWDWFKKLQQEEKDQVDWFFTTDGGQDTVSE